MTADKIESVTAHEVINTKGTRERTSVKQKLAEKKAEVEMKNPPEKKKERKSPGRGMEI